jgi:DNA-binding NarL/FixJ family response regulator
MMLHIAIIDDNTHLLDTFSSHFTHQETIKVTNLSSSIAQFEAVIPTLMPLDILFLDITLPHESGIEALPHLKELLPDTNIIIFTVHEDKENLLKAFCAGATGYLLKNTPLADLTAYIDIVQKGGSAISAAMAKKLVETVCSDRNLLKMLNETEYQVLELLAEGWSYKLIADKINMSVDGVRFYIKRVYRALNVNSKGEAIHLYYKKTR